MDLDLAISNPKALSVAQAFLPTPLPRLPGETQEGEPQSMRTEQPGNSQCLASLSAIDNSNRRFVLDIVSKDLISFLTGFPKFT